MSNIIWLRLPSILRPSLLEDNSEFEDLLLLRLWCWARDDKWFAEDDECKDRSGELTGEDAFWFIRDDKGDTEVPKWFPCEDGDKASLPFPPFSSLILSIVLSSIFSASKAEFGVDVRPPWEEVEPPPLSKDWQNGIVRNIIDTKCSIYIYDL